MNKIIFLMVFFIVLSCQVMADSIKGERIACITEDLYDQAITAAVRKDKRAWQYLLQDGNKCIIPRAGIKISILDTTWSGKAKVRAYLGNQTLELWTSIENIQRDQK